MYPKLSLLEAMAAAKADGFDAVECRTPFDHPKETVRDHLSELGQIMVQFNCPMGDFAKGDRGLTCLPGHEDEFRASIATTIAYAEALDAKQVNCVGGLASPGVPVEVIEDVMVANLKYAAPRLADAGIRLQVEPINSIATPGVFLGDLNRFARIHQRVAEPNLYLQYDFYHMQVVHGDLMRNFDRFSSVINHVQIADNPGRHEPGTGEIHFDYVFAGLEQRGYSGWVGCEYVPVGTVRQGLAWLERYRSRQTQPLGN
jgi:hydroxypyruvate isomerase